MLIQPYQTCWPEQFEQLNAELLKALPPEVHIEHVGSTSVPGLAAKPIIDLDMVYFPGEIAFSLIKTALENIRYEHRGNQGIPGREVFRRAAGGFHPVLDHISHHLYVCPAESPELLNHLQFRDYLRSHPEACQEYAALKYALANEAGQDRKRYALLKEERAKTFFEKIKRLNEEIRS